MFELNTADQFSSSEVTYHRGLLWVKGLMTEALLVAAQRQWASPQEIKELGDHTDKITWHSFRVTLLNAAVHAGKNS